jgi:cysteinyl-tRNA synthetase
MESGQFRSGNVADALRCLDQADEIFDVIRQDGIAGEAAFGQPTVSGDSGLTDAAIKQKVKEREEARKQKNFALSDAIRKELAEAGIILEDTKDGVRWRRK